MATSRTSARKVPTDPASAPPVETVEAADDRSAPIPAVQAEANHGSDAPEDIRDAQVAEPNDKPARKTGPHVETYRGAGVWECSKGDFVSRTSAAAVQEHIDAKH